MSNNEDSVNEFNAQAHTGEAFNKFVEESQEYISSLENENKILLSKLAEEQRLRIEAQNSVGSSVTLLSTAERVAKEYREESQAKADKELKEAHEYSQKTLDDAEELSRIIKAEANDYHTRTIAKASDDLAVITAKVDAKVLTYKEVVGRLTAFFSNSLDSLVEPQEDVLLLEDELSTNDSANEVETPEDETSEEANVVEDAVNAVDAEESIEAIATEEAETSEESIALEEDDTDVDSEESSASDENDGNDDSIDDSALALDFSNVDEKE